MNPSPGPRPLIWIADDSATERALTVRCLGDAFDYEQFSDGSEVVERLVAGSRQPDLLLLDWVMPGMAGDEVCRFLRSRADTRALPIIMVTASRIETQDVVRGLASGANDYVARPFAPEELRARVDSVLRAQELVDAASAERTRLRAINQLGRALFECGPVPPAILQHLVDSLTSSLCDGCSVVLLPGAIPAISVARHRADPTAAMLAAIAGAADPMVQVFDNAKHALEVLPPAYHEYIRTYGLRTLAVFPFPIRAPVQGVVTVTRDGASRPLDADDVATIETCIEYASLAVQNAVRFDAERSSRAQLDAMLAHAPVGIVVADREGACRLANPVARRLVPGLVEGAAISDALAVAGCGQTALDPAFVDALRGGAAMQTECTRQDPAAVTLALATAPLMIDAERLGSVMTLQDVSAERAIAAERERVSQYHEQMVAIVGHDLRNPLGAISAGAELLQLKTEDPFTLRVIERIRNSTGRMTRIIGQLLDVTLARLGSGIPIALVEVSLSSLARTVIDELRLAQSDVQLVFSSDGDVVGHWDPDRLGQVISNLTSNAIQYGDKGKPITVDVRAVGDNAVIVVENAVRDQPISPEQLAVLFEPYRRGEGSTKRASGLGLGLYIVKELVAAHRGTIVAESSPDGTRFRVTLPIRR